MARRVAAKGPLAKQISCAACCCCCGCSHARRWTAAGMTICTSTHAAHMATSTARGGSDQAQK
eukprot:scaffold43578_cov21-Tisochrysis_lutea.AAC.4